MKGFIDHSLQLANKYTKLSTADEKNYYEVL